MVPPLGGVQRKAGIMSWNFQAIVYFRRGRAPRYNLLYCVDL